MYEERKLMRYCSAGIISRFSRCTASRCSFSTLTVPTFPRSSSSIAVGPLSFSHRLSSDDAEGRVDTS